MINGGFTLDIHQQLWRYTNVFVFSDILFFIAILTPYQNNCLDSINNKKEENNINTTNLCPLLLLFYHAANSLSYSNTVQLNIILRSYMYTKHYIVISVKKKLLGPPGIEPRSSA